MLILCVEGEKKTASAANDGFIVLGFGGVDCHQQDGKPLPDLDLIDWEGNDVVLFFDSDYHNNPNVRRALNKLARELIRRGAIVRRAAPPDGPDGEKWGYDDCRVNLGKRKTMAIVANAEEMELPPDLILELNERYFVAPEGSKVFIFDETDGTPFSFTDFKNLHSNRYVENDGGKRISLGLAWSQDPNRRQYDKYLFDPGAPDDSRVYNRYKGFAFEPYPGDWSLFHAHIREIICGGNSEHFEYLLNWMARCTQRPGERAEIAIVLRGPQGTGKGVFANSFLELFKPHTYHASSASEVTGRFNSHLKDALVVFLDEAFYAGDKSHVGTLKKIITEQTLSVEEKYHDRQEVQNRLKIIIASNEHWVIPAGMQERRFLMLNVSSAKQQQGEYFDAITEQLKSGGYEALLYDLLARDISKFKHRKCPKTEALAEQQLYTMTSVESYWSEVLDNGVLPGPGSENIKGQDTVNDWGQVVRAALYNKFIDQERNRGLTHLPTIAQFGRQLKQLLPPGYPEKARLGSGDNRINVWKFPPLESCRKWFAERRGTSQ